MVARTRHRKSFISLNAQIVNLRDELTIFKVAEMKG